MDRSKSNSALPPETCIGGAGGVTRLTSGSAQDFDHVTYGRPLWRSDGKIVVEKEHFTQVPFQPGVYERPPVTLTETGSETGFTPASNDIHSRTALTPLSLLLIFSATNLPPGASAFQTCPKLPEPSNSMRR